MHTYARTWYVCCTHGQIDWGHLCCFRLQILWTGGGNHTTIYTALFGQVIIGAIYDRDLRLTGKEFFPQKNSLASTQLDEGMYACMNVSPYVLLTLLIKMTPYIIVELINIFRVFI